MKTRIAPWISDEILDQMFKRLEGIEWYTWVDGEYFPWYLIPKELVITEYRSKSGSCIISKSEDGHIPGNQSWMINDYLHLDQQEYYDLIELHIRFEEDRPKCNNPGCNQYVPWSNRLSSGYGNGRFDVHFCSRSCQLSYKYWQYPDKGIASISSHLKS